MHAQETLRSSVSNHHWGAGYSTKTQRDGLQALPPGFGSAHPGGVNGNSPTFQPWGSRCSGPSPEVTAESPVRRSSLRDLYPKATIPSVKTLGYCRLSRPGHPCGNPSGIARARTRQAKGYFPGLVLNGVLIRPRRARSGARGIVSAQGNRGLWGLGFRRLYGTDSFSVSGAGFQWCVAAPEDGRAPVLQ
jgi:hypothetical protein